MPPWSSAIAMPLSLTRIMRLDFKVAAMFRPSNAKPPDNEPSPITAMTLPVLPSRSRATAMPVAKAIEVEV